MTITIDLNDDEPKVLFTNGFFYHLIPPQDATGSDGNVLLRRIVLGGQPSEPDRSISPEMLLALIEAGEAVLLDAYPTQAIARRLARREASVNGALGSPDAIAKAAIEKVMLMLKSGDLRSASRMLDLEEVD